MNSCGLGGYLAGAAYPLPDDPTEFHLEGFPIVPCSRIRCEVCRETVRSVVGMAFRQPNEKVDLGPIFALADLKASSLLAPRAGARLYLCRCQRWLELSRRPLDDPDPEPFESPNVRWACAGHPSVTLPHDFDGARVATEAELGALVTRALHGELPARARADDRPRALWVARLYRRLAGASLSPVVERAALAVLDDPDPRARALALQFFFHLESEAGARRAVDLLCGDRRGFAGVRDEVTSISDDPTLEDTLWRVVTPLVAAPGPARDLARAEALASGKGRAALYAALAAGDAEWVSAHAEEIAGATPAMVKELMAQCRARFPRRVSSKAVNDRLRAWMAAHP